MQRICCLVFVRLKSTRVPNKLLQEVGGRTLLDRGLDYLVRLREACPNVTPLVCTPDEEISRECFRRGVDSCSDITKDAKSWPELIAPLISTLGDEELHLRERFDWIWDANVFCHPFLRLETGQEIVEAMENRQVLPFVVTEYRRGVVWRFQEPVIGRGELANTKTNPTYHQLAHIAYCWPVAMLDWTEKDLADCAGPLSLPLHWSELIDIDTPEDLEHARAVAKGAGL